MTDQTDVPAWIRELASAIVAKHTYDSADIGRWTNARQIVRDRLQETLLAAFAEVARRQRAADAAITRAQKVRHDSYPWVEWVVNEICESCATAIEAQTGEEGR